MSITTRQMNKPSARSCLHWGLGLVSLALIAPVSLALAAQPAAANGELANAPTQATTIDPVSGLVHGAPTTMEGVAMTVDSEGHVRAFCADPADSLAPAAMRDAIRPDVSRLRYE